MEKKLEYNWDLSVCNRDFILCNWDILSTKQNIYDLCSEKWPHTNLCKAITDLLRNGKRERAEELLWEHLNLKQNEKTKTN